MTERSVFIISHGQDEAVDFVLSNESDYYDKYRSIIDIATWDGRRWQGVDKAAAQLRAYVATIRHVILEGLDPESVDWERIVKSCLEEKNIESDRPSKAGL